MTMTSSTAQKWKIAQNGNVVLEDGTEVFDTDNINPEALQDLCDDWNSGMSNEKIKSNLEKDERLTGDEVDYIMEQIEIWEEKQQEMLKGNAETVVEEPATSKGEFVANVYLEDKKPAAEMGEPKPKKRQPRQARTTSAAISSKSVSAEDYIAQLQEKIELTKLVSDIALNDIPDNLTTKGKQLMVTLHKEHGQLIEKYLREIQTM